MSKEKKILPELRFPEFKNDGEWKPTTIEDNCRLKGRIGYRGYTKKDLVEKGNGALVIGGKHIQNNILDVSNPSFLTWEKYYESPEIMVEINHIIFSQRGTLGECAYIESDIGKATINPSMVLIKDITCNSRFLYYVLIGNQIQKEVERVSSLAAIPMLSQKQIKSFPFYIPLPKEQQKIANCLSSLDNLITAETEKLEHLKDHKKGLLQQLFPANGKTKPQFRFPEFENDGDWESRNLGVLCEYFNGASHEKNVTKDGEYYLISLNSIDIEGNLKTEMKRVNTFDNSLIKDDLVMVLSDVAHGNFLGLCAIIPNDKYVLNQRMAGLRLKNKDVNVQFLRFYINRSQKYFKQTGQGSSQQNLAKRSVEKFPVLLPKNQIEQEKIANCLSSADNLISAQTLKIKSLKKHKKGLMQRLFPNVNEVAV